MPNQISVIFEVDKDGSGRTTLRQIDSQIDGLGKTSKGTGSQIEGALSFVKTAIILEFFRQGAAAAFAFGKAAVEAFNEAQAAALGLQTVAKGAGVDPQAALAAVQNLDLVKNGLLTVAEASTALKNNLRTGFSLEQSIDLIKKFGDAAAFNKQSAISFGDAVVRTSEGIRQNLSTLADAGGITTNLSVILGRAGLTFEDLTDKTNGQANATKFYNELLKETAVFTGDAEKKANTFAGQQDALAAKQKILLQTVGEIIASNPALQEGFKSLGDTFEFLTTQLKDSDSALSKFVSNSAAEFGVLIDLAARFLRVLDGVAAVFNFLNPIGDALNPQFTTKEDAKFQADAKTKFDKNRTDFLAAQKKLADDLKQVPLLDAATQKAQSDLAKKTTDEISKSADAYFKKLEEANKRYADSIKQAQDATLDLQAKLSTNPLAAIFDAAERKQRDFIAKLGDIPKEFKQAFEKASQDISQLDFFKGVLAQGQGLNNLLNERAKLEAGGDPEKLARLQRENIDAQLRLEQDFLRGSQNGAQRQFALEQIVSTTSGDNLTPEQRDARFDALNQLIVVQQAAFKENFDRLTAQTTATSDNTLALVAVGNRLSAVEGALGNFKEGAIIKIIDETAGSVGIDLGSV